MYKQLLATLLILGITSGCVAFDATSNDDREDNGPQRDGGPNTPPSTADEPANVIKSQIFRDKGTQVYTYNEVANSIAGGQAIKTVHPVPRKTVDLEEAVTRASTPSECGSGNTISERITDCRNKNQADAYIWFGRQNGIAGEGDCGEGFARLFRDDFQQSDVSGQAPGDDLRLVNPGLAVLVVDLDPDFAGVLDHVHIGEHVAGRIHHDTGAGAFLWRQFLRVWRPVVTPPVVVIPHTLHTCLGDNIDHARHDPADGLDHRVVAGRFPGLGKRGDTQGQADGRREFAVPSLYQHKNQLRQKIPERCSFCPGAIVSDKLSTI